MTSIKQRIEQLERRHADDAKDQDICERRRAMQRILGDVDVFDAACALAERLNELGVSGSSGLLAIETDPAAAELAARLY